MAITRKDIMKNKNYVLFTHRRTLDAKLFDWSDEITADCPRKQV
jgi:hypothetical protein